MPDNTRETLRGNLAAIQKRIDSACARAGRSPSDVRIVAVTKYTPLPVVRELVNLGHRDLGENRPQQLIHRAAELETGDGRITSVPEQGAAPLHWHLIGQLQRNKVRGVLPHVAMIHSVDSLKLAERISNVAEELQRNPRLLLEVSLAGEESKSGFSRDKLLAAWEQLARLSHVTVCGLMTMAPLTEDPSVPRRVFRELRRLRDELQDRSPNLPLHELSMGMSNDFEAAVEEGATLVRLGTVLFRGTPDSE